MSPSAPVDFKALTDEAKGGIDIPDALKYPGKTVTAYEYVYGKANAHDYAINLGAKYPDNPLTVVIFAKSYANFPGATMNCIRTKIFVY